VKKWDGKSKLSSKRGRYGSSKVKAFTVLARIPEKHYLSVRQLCLLTGIDYYSLARALPKWVKWGYVTRYPTVSIGEGDYMYRLLSKGRSWLSLALEYLPNANKFIEELEFWQREIINQARFEEYRTLPFNEFVARLHELVRVSSFDGRRSRSGDSTQWLT